MPNLNWTSASTIMKLASTSLLVFLYAWCLAQQKPDSTWLRKPDVAISGFIDAFYAYDFNRPNGDVRQGFLYNHNRHNEFNVNLALFSIAVEQKRYRAKVSLQAGTYANDNYSGESATLKNIFEASAGIALDRKSKWWIDAGIMPSHLGFESVISIDNLTLTRSLAAENSPYFLSGMRTTFTPNEAWKYTLWICNGWQRIQRLQGNSLPGFGTGITYTDKAENTYNWSTYIGSEVPDSLRRMRYFNNFYAQFQLADGLKCIAGFDIGVQQKSNNSSAYEAWFVPTMITQFTLSKAWKCALRFEYYSDNKNVIIDPSIYPDFETSAVSFNVDYSPIKNVACRVETRQFVATDEIFPQNGTTTNRDFFIAASIAVRL